MEDSTNIGPFRILESWISHLIYKIPPKVKKSDDNAWKMQYFLKKQPAYIVNHLKYFFNVADKLRSMDAKNQLLENLRHLSFTLKFILNEETEEEIHCLLVKINEEIFNLIQHNKFAERPLDWLVVIFLYDKIPCYKHSEELDKLLWENLENSLKNHEINLSKNYLLKGLNDIAKYNKNSPIDLKIKKIFLDLALDWIILQRQNISKNNNDEILEILSAVNNVELRFKNDSDSLQFSVLMQNFEKWNKEYSLGEHRKIFNYAFTKMNINSVDDFFFGRLVESIVDERSNVTYSNFKGILKSTSAKVRIKCFSCANVEDLKKYESESLTLAKLSNKHEFFLKFYCSFYDRYINNYEETAYYIVTQHCSHSLKKELYHRIICGQDFTYTIAWDAYKLLDGFCKLKKHKIYHQDINPDNIFIDEDGNYKIGNFDLSLDFHTNENQSIIEKSNVFLLGIVFYNMITLELVLDINTIGSKDALYNKISTINPLWLSQLLIKILIFNELITFDDALERLMTDKTFLIDLFRLWKSPICYYQERIEEKCKNLDIRNNSILDLLGFLIKLDRCEINDPSLKMLALQEISQSIKIFTIMEPRGQRRRLWEKYLEILKFIEYIFNSDYEIILKEMTLTMMHGITHNRNKDSKINATLYDQNDFSYIPEEKYNDDSLSIQNRWESDGEVFDINQIEMNECELCVKEECGIKLERWKGHIKNPQKTSVSIKIYSYKNDISEIDANKWDELFSKEAYIMRLLSSKGNNFLAYYGSFECKFINITKFYIITEDWKNSLSEEIDNSSFLKTKYPGYLAFIVRELIESILIMKENRINHQGLSIYSILVPKCGNHLKVTDFCLITNRIKSVEFAAPEYFTSSSNFVRRNSDVFSLGLIFLSLAILKPISGLNINEEALCREVSNVEIPWLSRLLSKMLNFDYKNRLAPKFLLNDLLTDEEFLFDLSKWKVLDKFSKMRSMEKFIFSLSCEDLSYSCQSSLEQPNYEVRADFGDRCFYDHNCGSQSFLKQPKNDKIADFQNRCHTWDLIICQDNINECKKILGDIKKFSKRGLMFLKYYGNRKQIKSETHNEDRQLKYTIYLELCDKNITQFMEENKNLKNLKIIGIIYDLIRSFHYLVQKKIFITDLNSDDFIVNEFGKLKIFRYIKGFQYWSNIRKETEDSPILFWSPEIKMLESGNRDLKKISREKMVVYSIGLVIFYLFRGQPTDVSDFNSLQEKISEIQLEWVKEILLQMLNPVNKVRPRFRSILDKLRHNHHFTYDLEIYKLYSLEFSTRRTWFEHQHYRYI